MQHPSKDFEHFSSVGSGTADNGGQQSKPTPPTHTGTANPLCCSAPPAASWRLQGMDDQSLLPSEDAPLLSLGCSFPLCDVLPWTTLES